MEPDQFYRALHREADALAGARLFTVTVQDLAAGVVRRAYSSHPQDYPVSGTKPLQQDGWSRKVLVEGRTFVANSTAEFAPYFPDHAQINALGCQAAINMPVRDGAEIVGTVNILDVAGHFTPERVALFAGLLTRRHDDLVAAMRRSFTP